MSAQPFAQSPSTGSDVLSEFNAALRRRQSYRLHQGSAPLLVSMPHVGVQIPPALQGHYVPRALGVEDTDWHLSTLYDFLGELGASWIQPRYSRYVIDLNRPPDDTPMYPGASNTELCPTRFFAGDALYRPGCQPDAQEVQRRRADYWQPYHDALQAEIARLQALHGYVLLWDAHSIRSRIPWLFEGQLPALNIGTASGQSAHASITEAIEQALTRSGVEKRPNFVVNGRFKGGYITRHYGQPAKHVHTVQLEMCQHLYMQERAPFAYDAGKARRIVPVLRAMLGAALGALLPLYPQRNLAPTLSPLGGV